MSATLQGDLFRHYFSNPYDIEDSDDDDDSSNGCDEDGDGDGSDMDSDDSCTKDSQQISSPTAAQQQRAHDNNKKFTTTKSLQQQYPPIEAIYVGAKRFDVAVLHLENLLDNLQHTTTTTDNNYDNKNVVQQIARQQQQWCEQQQQQQPTIVAQVADGKDSKGRPMFPADLRDRIRNLNLSRPDSVTAMKKALAQFQGGGVGGGKNSKGGKGRGKHNKGLLSKGHTTISDRTTTTTATSKMLRKLDAPRAQVMRGLENVVRDLIMCLGRPGENILVFLPGINDLYDLHEHLLWSGPEFGDRESSDLKEDSEGQTFVPKAVAGSFRERKLQQQQQIHFDVIVLHSSVPLDGQEQAVHEDPPSDTCRIFLSSNIAESSLTLPKVRVVIDFGLRRQVVYDPKRRCQNLVTQWASRASVQQRMGRTGRVFPGLNIRLFPKDFYEDVLDEFDLAAMKTAPLEKTYIQAKFLAERLPPMPVFENFDSCNNSEDSDFSSDEQQTDQQRQEQGLFDPISNGESRKNNNNKTNNIRYKKLRPVELLRKTPTPPAISNIFATLKALADVAAITSAEEEAPVTILGRLMVHLGVDGVAAQLVLYGCLLGCAPEAVVIAAGMSEGDPFAQHTFWNTSGGTTTTTADGTNTNTTAEKQDRAYILRMTKLGYLARQHFAGGMICSEHLTIRNLLVSWMVGFVDFKNERRYNEIKVANRQLYKLQTTTDNNNQQMANNNNNGQEEKHPQQQQSSTTSYNNNNRTTNINTRRRCKLVYDYAWKFAEDHRYTIACKRLVPICNRIREICDKLLIFVDQYRKFEQHRNGVRKQTFNNTSQQQQPQGEIDLDKVDAEALRKQLEFVVHVMTGQASGDIIVEKKKTIFVESNKLKAMFSTPIHTVQALLVAGLAPNFLLASSPLLKSEKPGKKIAKLLAEDGIHPQRSLAMTLKGVTLGGSVSQDMRRVVESFVSNNSSNEQAGSENHVEFSGVQQHQQQQQNSDLRHILVNEKNKNSINIKDAFLKAVATAAADIGVCNPQTDVRARLIKSQRQKGDTTLHLEFSPESSLFSQEQVAKLLNLNRQTDNNNNRRQDAINDCFLALIQEIAYVCGFEHQQQQNGTSGITTDLTTNTTTSGTTRRGGAKRNDNGKANAETTRQKNDINNKKKRDVMSVRVAQIGQHDRYKELVKEISSHQPKKLLSFLRCELQQKQQPAICSDLLLSGSHQQQQGKKMSTSCCFREPK